MITEESCLMQDAAREESERAIPTNKPVIVEVALIQTNLPSCNC